MNCPDLIGQFNGTVRVMPKSNWTVCTITGTLKWLFITASKKTLEFLLCHPNRSVIILVIKQIGLPRILLITRMITDQIGLHSVLLPSLIIIIIIIIIIKIEE